AAVQQPGAEREPHRFGGAGGGERELARDRRRRDRERRHRQRQQQPRPHRGAPPPADLAVQRHGHRLPRRTPGPPPPRPPPAPPCTLSPGGGGPVGAGIRLSGRPPPGARTTISSPTASTHGMPVARASCSA